MAKKGTNGADIDARRELIDILDCCGLRPQEILKRLQDKDFLKDSKYPIGVVYKDLEAVREKRKELIQHNLPDNTKADFIGQQAEVFAQAIKYKDHHSAIEASKNIAKARGLDIDKLVIEGTMEQTIRKIWVGPNGDNE